jgi:hypothetical protein
MTTRRLTSEAHHNVAAHVAEESPYDCPDCGKKLVDVKGYWGCLCRWNGRMPSADTLSALGRGGDFNQ